MPHHQSNSRTLPSNGLVRWTSAVRRATHKLRHSANLLGFFVADKIRGAVSSSGDTAAARQDILFWFTMRYAPKHACVTDDSDLGALVPARINIEGDLRGNQPVEHRRSEPQQSGAYLSDSSTSFGVARVPLWIVGFLEGVPKFRQKEPRNVNQGGRIVCLSYEGAHCANRDNVSVEDFCDNSEKGAEFLLWDARDRIIFIDLAQSSNPYHGAAVLGFTESQPETQQPPNQNSDCHDLSTEFSVPLMAIAGSSTCSCARTSGLVGQQGNPANNP